jgi:hypothetical protein
MKKFLSICAIITAFTLGANAQRFSVANSGDNTGQSVTYAAPVAITYTAAATDSIAPNASETWLKINVSAAHTIHVKKSRAQKFDVCHIIFYNPVADNTTRLMTMTGIDMYPDINTDTISVMSSRISRVDYVYDGIKWIKSGRYQQH